MGANLSEPLTLLEIADRADLSHYQNERLCRQHKGRSPARYYLEIRLDRARHLLLQTLLPVVEVALACGFVSPHIFQNAIVNSMDCRRSRTGRWPVKDASIFENSFLETLPSTLPG